MNDNPYRGTDFADFLAEEGILAEVTLRAQKRLRLLEEVQRLPNVELLLYGQGQVCWALTQ